jgi:hypothetical protein
MALFPGKSQLPAGAECGFSVHQSTRVMSQSILAALFIKVVPATPPPRMPSSRVRAFFCVPATEGST